MTDKPPFSCPVPGVTALPGETVPRRHPAALDELVTKPHPDVSTTFEMVQYAAKEYGDAPAMGTRKLIKTHTEVQKVHKLVDGRDTEVDKTWVYFELGPYGYTSFREYEELVHQVGAGLHHLGLHKADRMHIYAATSMHWLAMSHAAASRAMTFVTAYDTLGEEGLRHSMVATDSKLLFLDPHLLPTLMGVLDEAKEIRHVVWNSQHKINEKQALALKEKYPYLNILSFEELRRLGEDNPCKPAPSKPEDVCCIMYTSGSTGTPKGVALTQANVVSASKSAFLSVPPLGLLTQVPHLVAGLNMFSARYLAHGDRNMTYLPLAHILEFVSEHCALFNGYVMGYGNPKTLADSQVRNCAGDIREFKPSFIAGVPAVFESIKKGIISKVSAGSPIVRGLFWGALTLKSILIRYKLPGWGILDAIVFDKIRAATGGNIKAMICGGGPIARDTQEFISMAIAPLVKGYGLTECTAAGAIMPPNQWTMDALGQISPSLEIKLVDFPEAGYFVTNKPYAQGEVLLRGPCVSTSYFKNETETKAAMTDDGWFRTGDVGEFLADGHLRLIDRKKNLVKTLNGEYIALEKLEAVYRASPLVANLCIYADERHSKPIAIIVPAEPALKSFAHTHGVVGDNLVGDARLQGLVLESLQKLGKESGLVGIEIVDAVVLCDEEWTPLNVSFSLFIPLSRHRRLSLIPTVYRA